MLGPVSRFPLGLLDLFGVKQMGAYPGEIAQAYQPTLDLLQATVRANSLQTPITLPINLAGVATQVGGTYPILEDGTNQLRTQQNEVMIITAWSLQHTVTGAGAEVPDCQLAYDAASGGQRIVFTPSSGVVTTAGIAGQSLSFAYGSGECFVFVPPGNVINLVQCQTAISVAGGDARVAACLRFLKMRV